MPAACSRAARVLVPYGASVRPACLLIPSEYLDAASVFCCFRPFPLREVLPRFQPRWSGNLKFPRSRRLAVSLPINAPWSRAWSQAEPFHASPDRSGDYLCRLLSRVFVGAFLP